MSYSIHITATAERDILRAADYIKFTLKNPTAAEHLLDAATKQINSLSDMPEKYYLVDDPVLASWEIRFIIINNYLAFYTIDKANGNCCTISISEKQLELHSPSEFFPCCTCKPDIPVKQKNQSSADYHTGCRKQ